MTVADWCNPWYCYSRIRFVTPGQRHSGQAVAICSHREQLHEPALQQHPRRWSRSTCSWLQPEVVWINPPPPENSLHPTALLLAA